MLRMRVRDGEGGALKFAIMPYDFLSLFFSTSLFPYKFCTAKHIGVRIKGEKFSSLERNEK